MQPCGGIVTGGRGGFAENIARDILLSEGETDGAIAGRVGNNEPHRTFAAEQVIGVSLGGEAIEMLVGVQVSNDSTGDRRGTEADLDETIEESFPASDPPSRTGETGTRLDVTPSPDAVTDNRDAHQFELVVDGATSVMVYQRTPTSLILVHTEVPPPVRGRHLAATLAQAAINAAHAQGLRVVAVCPFVKAYMRRHPAR